MRIVVGTDFSTSARQAADLAAALARPDRAPVLLVHARERSDDGASPAAVRARLETEAARVRASGAAVEVRLADVPPAQALLAAVERHRADLLVVGVIGQRAPARWALGSTTEQVAQASPVPVLGLRFEEAFHPWLHERAPLAVLYADDGSAGSAAALAWSNRLEELGPVRLTAARVVSARSRPGWWPFPRVPLPRRGALERQLARRVERLSRAAEIEVLVRETERPVAQELLALAAETRVALILAGSQQRTGLRRLWTSSVARSLLAGSLVSVLMVPVGAPGLEARPDQEREPAGLPG